MKRLPLALFVWLLAAMLAPPGAWAQQAESQSSPQEGSALSRRGYRGLFAPPADPDQKQALVLTASLYGAYDDNVFAAQGRGTLRRDVQPSGYYSGAQSDLHYRFSGDRINFSSGGGVDARYYTQLEKELVTLYHEATAFSASLGANTRVALGQALVYTPFYRFNLFSSFMELDDPEAGIGSEADLDTYKRPALRHSGVMSLSQGLGRRSDLQVAYHLRYVDFTESGFNDYRSQAASIGFTHRLTSHAALRAGYGYRTGDVVGGDAPASEVHHINLGVDYSRALSISRRTRFSFGTGSALITSDRLSVPDSESRTRFRLTGNANLTHEMGRSWTANLQYRRGLAFREGFNDPFVTDSVGAEINGFASRRLELSAGVRYVHAVLVATNRGGYDGIVGSAQAKYGLSHYLALFARYFYYDYEFGRDIQLDPRFATEARRQGVRVGVTTSIPLIR